MFSFRDFIVFLAGVEFCHTLSHILLPMFIPLPVEMSFILFTKNMNTWAIIINAIITLVLLWWAARLAKSKKKL